MSLSLSDLANKAQRQAANPFISAWVSASAGSGKTKVLTDRVLRLLLVGNAPETILCLTFTKAAAAEMSNRLSKTLRDWLSLDTPSLMKKLMNLTGQTSEELTDKIDLRSGKCDHRTVRRFINSHNDLLNVELFSGSVFFDNFTTKVFFCQVN